MGVTVQTVEKNSPASRVGVQPGDLLVRINGHAITDFLDYNFYASTTDPVLYLKTPDGKHKLVKTRKAEYDDLGLGFATYLMDQKHSCRNKCMFCFVDQMPGGMRESLYFKDDDERLSFLFGNYITLTNLSEHDVQRIIDMKISPINVSVHTTDPALRVRMMKNKNAGRALAYLGRFAEAGIRLNCQLVLCPGINDAKQLEKSLRDLGRLYPAVQSIACVPVGLTKFRKGLEPLEPYTP
ncbi:MAG: PDZ domain-containing protein, partial [Oscillospiraceae bacterium]